VYGEAVAGCQRARPGGTRRSVTATFDAYGIKPAKTPRGRADQLERMLGEMRGGRSGPELAIPYGPLLELLISENRRAGNPGKPRERVERHFADNPETRDKLLALIARGEKSRAAKITRDIAAETKTSRQTVNRVLEAIPK
jgi:hypothetical protein